MNENTCLFTRDLSYFLSYLVEKRSKKYYKYITYSVFNNYKKVDLWDMLVEK